MSKISYLFGNISGLSAYFSKPIIDLKPWAEAGRFEYHKPYNRKNFFRTYKGVFNYAKENNKEVKNAIQGVQELSFKNSNSANFC